MTTIARLRQLYDRYDQADALVRPFLLLFRLWPALDRKVPDLLWRAWRFESMERLIGEQAARIRELEAQIAERRAKHNVYSRRHKAKARAVRRARVEQLAAEIEAEAGVSAG